MSTKRDLADGVYVDVDERGIVITTENGIEVTNTIVMDTDVLYPFLIFVRDVLPPATFRRFVDMVVEP